MDIKRFVVASIALVLISGVASSQAPGRPKRLAAPIDRRGVETVKAASETRAAAAKTQTASRMAGTSGRGTSAKRDVPPARTSAKRE